MHSKQRPLTEWEDVFVMSLGHDWRSILDQCNTYQDWRQGEINFITRVCNAWDLPVPSDVGSDLPSTLDSFQKQTSPAKKQRGNMHLKDQLLQHSLTPATLSYAWTRRRRSFVFIVDCLPVQSVSCGHSLLTAPELKDTFRRICDNLGAICSCGWQPPRPTGDPVQWQRRIHNLVADGLVNYTMDVERTWFRTFDWPFHGESLESCNVRVHSDGGTRRHRCSASAWVMEVGVLMSDLEWLYRPIAMSGTYFKEPESSFATESWALEEATEFMKRLLERGVGTEPPGKRAWRYP